MHLTHTIGLYYTACALIVQALKRLDLLEDWMSELVVALRKTVLDPLVAAAYAPPPQIAVDGNRYAQGTTVPRCCDSSTISLH
jgi:hypothetical protein